MTLHRKDTDTGALSYVCEFLRRKLLDDNGNISAVGALVASTCAGVVGASSSTPLDVSTLTLHRIICLWHATDFFLRGVAKKLGMSLRNVAKVVCIIFNEISPSQ